VIAGGKKQPEMDALQMAYDSLQAGAIGVDMGRNIFQSEDPVAMIKAVRSIVHEQATPEEAYQLFSQEKR
jgi:putative autoinducer-2 (AI-2) aldolase